MLFKQFYMLQEQMKRADIIDTYVLMSMPDIDDPAAQFVKKEIMDIARDNITQELIDIIFKELKHSKDEGNINEMLRVLQNVADDVEMELDVHRHYASSALYAARLISEIIGLPSPKNQKDLIQNIKKYLRSTKQLLRDINKNNLSLQTVYNCFKYLDWVEYYGGDNWAKITSHVIKIANTKSPMEFFKALDRLVDFVHNTGSILTKFKGFQEGWIQFILDLKEKAINIRELIPYVSPEVRKMFGSQEWRTFMKHIPGEGAETSFESYKQMLPKYIKKIADTLEQDPYIGENEVIRYASAVGEMIKKIGRKKVESFIKDISPKVIADAAVALNMFQIPKQAKLGASFIRSYVERNHPKEYKDALKRFNNR